MGWAAPAANPAGQYCVSRRARQKLFPAGLCPVSVLQLPQNEQCLTCIFANSHLVRTMHGACPGTASCTCSVIFSVQGVKHLNACCSSTCSAPGMRFQFQVACCLLVGVLVACVVGCMLCQVCMRAGNAQRGSSCLVQASGAVGGLGCQRKAGPCLQPCVGCSL